MILTPLGWATLIIQGSILIGLIAAALYVFFKEDR